MKGVTKKIALCLMLGTCTSFASETVELACPSPQYSVDPEISVATSRTGDVYTYRYKVTYKVASDAIAAFLFPSGFKDFKVVSWGGDFKRCWKMPPISTQPGYGLACTPNVRQPGETWKGDLVLTSKASPGAWKYYVTSMHYHSPDEDYPPRVETYLKSPEGDEAFQEAALEQCSPQEWTPFGGTIMTGALLAPTGVPGISPEAVLRANRSGVDERVRRLVGAGRRSADGAATLTLRSSGGWHFGDSAGPADRATVRGPVALRCQERGVFAEVLEGDRVVARQGWQVEAAPHCGQPGTLLIDIP